MQKIIITLLLGLSLTRSFGQVIASPAVLAMTTSGIGNTAIQLGCRVDNIRLAVAPMVRLEEDPTTATGLFSSGDETGTAFSAYPNPANDNFLLSAKFSQPGNAKIFLYNTLGQALAEFNTAYSNNENFNQQIATAQYPSGIYFIQIVFTGDNDGMQHRSTQKIQIVH